MATTEENLAVSSNQSTSCQKSKVTRIRSYLDPEEALKAAGLSE